MFGLLSGMKKPAGLLPGGYHGGQGDRVYEGPFQFLKHKPVASAEGWEDVGPRPVLEWTENMAKPIPPGNPNFGHKGKVVVEKKKLGVAGISGPTRPLLKKYRGANAAQWKAWNARWTERQWAEYAVSQRGNQHTLTEWIGWFRRFTEDDWVAWNLTPVR